MGYSGFKSSLFVIAAAFLLSACSVEQEKTKVEEPKKNERQLTIVGSHTVGEVLGLELVKSYLLNQGYDISTSPKGNEIKHVTGTKGNEILTVVIESRGSSSGFLAFTDNSADIAMASRPIKDKEVEKLMPIMGDMRSPYAQHVVALDGIAVIVNPSNPVSSLTEAQIAGLMGGTITNWSEVGGANVPVKILTRDRLSGTLSSFNKLVMKPNGKKIPLTAQEFSSTDDMMYEALVNDGAIGFVGVGGNGSTKVISINNAKGKVISPNTRTIADGSYGLARSLYMYTPPQTSNQDVLDFMRFIRSKDGHQVVMKSGKVPPKIEALASN